MEKSVLPFLILDTTGKTINFYKTLNQNTIDASKLPSEIIFLKLVTVAKKIRKRGEVRDTKKPA